MEYLPGDPLDYERDLEAAAHLFARLHNYSVQDGAAILINEIHPLSQTYEECQSMAAIYCASPQADAETINYLHEVLDWANEARQAERFFLEDPILCVINTEVNSGNFIVNRQNDTIHLIDWEKPLWGDPSQDLSHFSVPTTTLWKTNYCMSAYDRKEFLEIYRSNVLNHHLRDTIFERVALRDPFNCLRGVCWSAKAYVQYQSGLHVLQNTLTAQKIRQYLQLDFLHNLFDPLL
jgi:thiamine kinase-like enzyme